MRIKTLLLVTLFIASGSVLAEQNLLGTAGKQLLKDTATSAAPKEAVEGAEAASQTLENANKLKESVKSAPEALKSQAQDIATESAKQKLNEAVPEEAKQGMKTIESTTETAKQLKGTLPKSTGEAAEAIKGKAKEEATKKAFDLLQ